MFWHIKILLSLLCLLLLHQNVNAKDCPAGQRFKYNTDICEDCPEGLYSQRYGDNCKVCSKCKQGSEELSECTLTNDTGCRCMPGFTPMDKKKHTVCFCEIGSGVDNAGNACTKCRDGFFTDKKDTKCRKWRECRSGIKEAGNRTSDVVCKEEEKIEVTVLTEPVLNVTLPQTTTSYIAPSSTKVPLKTKDRFYSLWLVLLCGGILLLLGLVYHKCKITRCIHNKINVDSRKDSTCRKPVEESGEKCLSLLV